MRHSHGEDLDEYIRLARNGKNLLIFEPLTESVRNWERLMLGLRTNEGVFQKDVEDFARPRGIRYQEKFDLLQKRGFLSLKDHRYRVTSRGYFVLNGILEALVA